MKTDIPDTVGLHGRGQTVIGGPSWVELPDVERKVTTRDAAGRHPPLVPTPEGVERWGHLWWADGEVVAVSVSGPRVKYYVHGESDDNDIEWAGLWSGPVLERPVKKEG